MKSGNLNVLEPSGPLQACNVTALPLPLPQKLTFKSANANKKLLILRQILRKIHNAAVNSWFLSINFFTYHIMQFLSHLGKQKTRAVATTWGKPTDNSYQAK